MSAARSVYLWLVIAIVTVLMYVVGLPLFLIAMPFDRQRKFGHYYASFWGRVILRLNRRWSHEVLNADKVPRGRPLVVVSNHQGIGDILMAFCLNLQFKWISKRSNFYVPCMGWFMYHAGYIPLRRGKKSSIVQCMARARRYLDDGVSVLFFPEGTRSRDGKLLPFKSGAFRVAIDSGVDILPIAITGTYDALPVGGWKFPDSPSTMKLIVGDVISTKGLLEQDLPALIERTERVVFALKTEAERTSAPLASTDPSIRISA
jgi:1-acyl-sn-glycerol-3-phosphate acyltransferase